MIGRKGKFWGGSEKQSAMELMWRQAADCSRGGFQPPETHDRRRWTGGGWSRGLAGCSRKDTVAPDNAGIGKRAQPAWNQCVLETATSEGRAASVWCAHAEKIDVSVWRRHWAPTDGDRAGTQPCECGIAVIKTWHNQRHILSELMLHSYQSTLRVWSEKCSNKYTVFHN